MRTLIITFALFGLSACGTLCWDDTSGLDGPPANSKIPAPHG